MARADWPGKQACYRPSLGGGSSICNLYYAGAADHARGFVAWLQGSLEEAAALQQPLPAEALRIVATGARKDEGGMGAA